VDVAPLAHQLPEERLHQPFPARHYQNCLQLVQADLASRGLAAGVLVDPENLFWLTGYRSMGYWTFQALIVPRSGLPILVSRIFNKPLSEATPTIGGFETIGDSDDAASVLNRALQKHVSRGGDIGFETGARNFTGLLLRALEQQAQGFRILDWNGVCEQHRRLKTQDQLGLMRKAADAAVAGLDAALRCVAPGRSENDVAAAMLAGSVRAGSDFFRVPLVVTGPATALCFTTWERRVIRPGHVVLLESASCVDRYHAMIARTCIVGRASDDHRAVAGMLLDMLDRAIDAIRPGVTSGEVFAAANQALEGSTHYRRAGQRIGYSIGIGFPPNWAEGHFLDLKADDPTILEPGMTFHIVPSMFTPDFGMWFSESVAVASSGVEVLTHYPRQLFELET